MADASFAQGNFLGGEWSLSYQGRVDHPNYKKAMAKCRNSYPAAEGCLVRRPGFRFIATTRSGAAGRILAFQFANQVPYNIELTDGHMRFFNGPSLVFNNDAATVTAFSTANPGVVTTSAPYNWTTGTQIQFFGDASTYPDKFAILRNRQFALTTLSSTTFKVADPVTGAFLDGNTVNADFTHVTPFTAKSVLDVATPWTGTNWSGVRLVQAPNHNVMLHGSVAPYQLTLTPTADTTIATASLAAANILDGPYLDIDNTGAFLQPALADVTKPNLVQFYISFPAYSANTSYNTGALVVDVGVAYQSLVDDNLGHTPASSATYWTVVDAGVINGSGGFTSADIGRCVRLLSEPAVYAAGTTYVTGNAVKYDGVYYKSLVDANTGNTPDKSVTSWVPTTDTNVAKWVWGRITAVGSGASPRFTLELIGGNLLYVDGTPGDFFIYSFRLGLYGSPGINWPACGVYHQGRLWLGGAQSNRIDSSKSNDFFNFSPTGPDGTVADNNAISATFNSSEINQIYWMIASGQGILCGTKGGEWIVQASQLNDPISPTNIQANEVTHYGCANVPPIKTGMATVFVQKYQRKCMELLTDVFSGKYSAPDLSEAAKHFTDGTISELAYQEELAPIVWVRAGSLIGITYRRNSPFITDAASFSAWHKHEITTTALQVESICTGPSSDADQTIDVLSAVIYDPTAGARQVVTMAAPIDESSSLYESFFLDQAHVPAYCLQTASGITAYGLHYLEGQSVDVWGCGLDLGTYTVSGGSIAVPFGADAGGLFTLALAQSLNATTNLFGNQISRQSAGTGATPYWFPFLVGKTYTSEHQLLRPATPEDTGARNGPALGKTRRAHQGALQLVNCVTGSIQTGIQDTNRTVASTLRTQTLRTQGGTAYDALTLFTGIHWFMLDDDYNFDSMLYWRVTRPYPMTVCQAGAFLHTQDR